MLKLLLLFTLLTTACYGQDYVFIDTNLVNELGKTFERIKKTTQRMVEMETDTPQTDSNPHDFYSNVIGSNSLSAFEKLSLEEKLLLYAQECYNDSSKYCYYIWCDGTCHEVLCDCNSINGRGNVMIGVTCKTKYIHRKPTFEGFIEWLRKKQ